MCPAVILNHRWLLVILDMENIGIIRDETSAAMI